MVEETLKVKKYFLNYSFPENTFKFQATLQQPRPDLSYSSLDSSCKPKNRKQKHERYLTRKSIASRSPAVGCCYYGHGVRSQLLQHRLRQQSTASPPQRLPRRLHLDHQALVQSQPSLRRAYALLPHKRRTSPRSCVFVREHREARHVPVEPHDQGVRQRRALRRSRPCLPPNAGRRRLGGSFHLPLRDQILCQLVIVR